MITIEKRNGIWELYVNGGLETWNEDLKVVTDYLSRKISDIELELENEEIG